MIATTFSVLTKEVNQHQFVAKEISTLEDKQKLVGGLIECISLPCNIDLWVNEEGAINGMDVNLMILWDDDPNFHQPIFGPVFLAGVDEKGDTTSLSEFQRKWIAHQLKLARLKNGNNIIAIDLRERGER